MKLGLGTVQFGLDYGISNKSGQTKYQEAEQIVHYARNNGVKIIDTAQEYGNSEKVLGEIGVEDLKIVTKIGVNGNLQESLKNLRQDSIYALLAHNADELINSDKLWNRFLEYKSQGLVEKIGVSVYDEMQIDAIIKKYNIDIIQLPINIYDQRLLKSGHIEKIKDNGIEIHARSIFLQGLVFLNPNNLPKFFNQYKDIIETFLSFITERKISPLEAALDFINSIENIDHIILGINKIVELINIMEVFNNLKKMDYSSFIGSCDEKLINPTNWRISD